MAREFATRPDVVFEEEEEDFEKGEFEGEGEGKGETFLRARKRYDRNDGSI